MADKLNIHWLMKLTGMGKSVTKLIAGLKKERKLVFSNLKKKSDTKQLKVQLTLQGTKEAFGRLQEAAPHLFQTEEDIALLLEVPTVKQKKVTDKFETKVKIKSKNKEEDEFFTLTE